MPDKASPTAAIPLAGLDRIRYESGYSILLFSDDDGQRSRLAEMVSLGGGRVSIAAPLADAVARISEHAAPDGVFCDVVEADDEITALIIEIVARGAAAGRFHSAVLIGRDQIDLASACIGQRDVMLLCEPDPAHLAQAISSLMVRHDVQLNDISADAAPLQLRQLSEEVSRIAKTLASLSHTSELLLIQEDDQDEPDHPVVGAPAIRAMIRARRLRAHYFHAELFADPAWDMLLDLSAARLEKQCVPVSSLCIAATVPATTALRCISKMTEFGLLTRQADPQDRRRAFIELADHTFEAMMRCIAAMLRTIRAAS